MVALRVDEMIVDLAARAVEARLVFNAVGEVEDAIVAIEMHVLWTSEASVLRELLAALRSCP